MKTSQTSQSESYTLMPCSDSHRGISGAQNVMNWLPHYWYLSAMDSGTEMPQQAWEGQRDLCYENILTPHLLYLCQVMSVHELTRSIPLGAFATAKRPLPNCLKYSNKKNYQQMYLLMPRQKPCLKTLTGNFA